MADAQSYSDVVLSDGTTSWQFTYAINDQQPYVRQTNDFRRQQIDTSPEPGEQTLSQWWVRSQDSWHRGAGIQNYEPGSNHETQYRFSYGNNLNPWSSGNIQNSNSITTDASGSGAWMVNTAVYGGVTYAYRVDGSGVMTRYLPSGGGSPTTYTAASTIGTAPTFAGTTVLVGGLASGTIMSGSATGSAVTNLWTGGPASTTVEPFWVKNRIIAVAGDKLWELTLAGGSFPGSPTFTAPTTGGTWTAVAEAPDCILASYNCAGRGYVYAIRLNESTTAGSTPTLGACVQVAQMPPGEEIWDMKTYLGSFVAFGTTYGVRVGELGNNGSMNYGPLTIDTTPTSGATTYPCYALGSRGRYVFAGINDPRTGYATIARIDLSQEILNYTNTGYASKTLRYAYNYDVELSGSSGSNPVNGIAGLGTVDGAVYAVQGKGVYSQVNGSYISGGSFYSGRVRYGTTEPKNFCYLRLNATVPSSTSINIYILDYTGAETFVTTVTNSTDLSSDILLPVGVRNGQYPWVEVKFVLNSDNANLTAKIDSWSIKSNPLPRIQRLIQYPLRLVDWEMDRNGVKIGYEGSAFARLVALEALEQQQSLITLTDRTSGETFTGIIQKIQFVRDTAPSRNATNFGGVVMVTVLKV